MPATDVFFYQEADGSVPAIKWLDSIAANPRDKLFRRVCRLEVEGHELRRPESAYLRDGIYELRVRHQQVNYRLLYFFYDKEAVIAHGCTKEAKVDHADIERAIKRKTKFWGDPVRHRHIPADDE